MKDFARLCLNDLTTRLKNSRLVQNKVYTVYDQEHLMDVGKGIVFPCVGVLYEGTRSVSNDQNQASHRVGLSAEAVFAITLMTKPDVFGSDKNYIAAVDLMDDIREQVLDSKAPTGHYWRFVVEAAAQEKNGVVSWVQRWTVPVQIVPSKSVVAGP